MSSNHGPQCRFHDDVPKLGYLAAHDDAEQRMRRKEQQIRCPDCGLCIWESYYRMLPGESIVVNRVIIGYHPATTNPKYVPNHPIPQTTCLNCLQHHQPPAEKIGPLFEIPNNNDDAPPPSDNDVPAMDPRDTPFD